MPRSSLSSSSSTVALGRLRASLSKYGGAAIATEKKPLLIGHCALRAILCFNRGDSFDTALLSMGNAALTCSTERVSPSSCTFAGELAHLTRIDDGDRQPGFGECGGDHAFG